MIILSFDSPKEKMQRKSDQENQPPTFVFPSIALHIIASGIVAKSILMVNPINNHGVEFFYFVFYNISRNYVTKYS
ncbi:MAG: hypothetical protein ABI315_05740 [Bacteroidia bacterium]